MTSVNYTNKSLDLYKIKQQVRYYLNQYDKNGKLLNDIPGQMYKYTSLNKYTLHNLDNQKITLTSPRLFNDPYDSIINTRVDTQYAAFGPGISKQERKAALKELNNKRFNNKHSSYRTLGRDVLRVASLTTRCDNLLMWSHYGDTNCGICVGYNMSNYVLSKNVFPVLYLQDMDELFTNADLGIMKNIDEISVMIASSLIKGNVWKYENEWRIVVTDGKNGCHDRILKPSPTVDVVYLGPEFVNHWLELKTEIRRALFNIRRTFTKDYLDIINTDAQQLELLYKFCDIIKKRKIPLYSMVASPDNFKYVVDKKISVDVLKRLNFSELRDHGYLHE